MRCVADDLTLSPDKRAGSPLGNRVCCSCSLACPDAGTTFANVMMHSMLSPAYTLGSFQRTKALMFEGASEGAMAWAFARAPRLEGWIRYAGAPSWMTVDRGACVSSDAICWHSEDL